MKVRYKIKFFSYWHCGSGLTSGADLNLLTIKDEYGLPFIPGKTIKGLLREAIEELNELKNANKDDLIKEAFGYFNKESKDIIAIQGQCFFKNAELPTELKKEIIAGQLSQFLYEGISSTAIDKNGVADENSLRKMEVCIPCELEGSITGVSEKLKDEFKEGFQLIKRLGQNRNRGLGRCLFYDVEFINEGGLK